MLARKCLIRKFIRLDNALFLFSKDRGRECLHMQGPDHRRSVELDQIAHPIFKIKADDTEITLRQIR